MKTILADAIINISLSNNIIRVTLGEVTADQKVATTGTILIPANVAGNIISGLANGVNQISEKLKQQQEVDAAEALIRQVEEGEA